MVHGKPHTRMYGTVKLCPGSGALLGALARSTGWVQMPLLVCEQRQQQPELWGGKWGHGVVRRVMGWFIGWYMGSLHSK